MLDDDAAQPLGAVAEVRVGDPRSAVRSGAARGPARLDDRRGAPDPDLVGDRPRVDVPERRAEVFERPAVGAAAGGREQPDGGVRVLVGAAEVVEVLERRRVGAAVDGRAGEDAVGLADAALQRLAVALRVLVGVVQREVDRGQVDQVRLGAGVGRGVERDAEGGPRGAGRAPAAGDGDDSGHTSSSRPDTKNGGDRRGADPKLRPLVPWN